MDNSDPREQLSVYDPDLDKRFIMKDGEVVEDNGDGETPGTGTCCGCFTARVPGTEIEMA